MHRSPASVAIAGMLALAVAMGVGRFAYTPLMPMMEDDAGLTLAAGSWLAAVNYIGYLLGALTAAALPLRSATAIRLGLAVICASTLGMGLLHDYAAWLALRALAGVASAWVLVRVSAWSLAHLAPLRRPLLRSTVFAGVGIGIMLAGALCLLMMALAAGSARTWLALGGLASLASLAVVSVLDARERDTPPSRRAPSPARPPHKEAARLVVCYGAFGFGYIIPATYLPLMAKQAIADPAVFGWSWPLFGAAAAASTLGVAALARSHANRRIWIGSHLVMALGVALPLAAPGIYAIAISALLVGGTFMVATMTGIQEAHAVAGRSATPLIAAMTAAFALGQIAGPLAASAAVRLTGGFSAALAAASVLLVLSAWTLDAGKVKVSSHPTENPQ